MGKAVEVSNFAGGAGKFGVKGMQAKGGGSELGAHIKGDVPAVGEDVDVGGRVEGVGGWKV